jgi:hypothetical protein
MALLRYRINGTSLQTGEHVVPLMSWPGRSGGCGWPTRRGTAIAGGSTFIQRNIVAERILRMPRS